MPESTLPSPDIILEAGSVLVVNKPGGLLTQAPPGIDSLELRIKRWLIERDQKPGKSYLGVPHRLDRPVSGVIVVAKNVRATNRISQQFQLRTVTKKYWAVVEGDVPDSEGCWVDSMRKIPDEARSEIVDSDHPEGKEAILNFRLLRQSHGLSLLEIQLQTGRTHQIRVQCSARGCPIVGDTLYGSSMAFGPQTPDIRKRWIALHSRQIMLEHPVDKTPVACVAPLADYWSVFEDFHARLRE
jgi:RluA family pseudouridine synthase